MSHPVYILGTGLSHNGSAVLLKDGKVCVAIEKERISRIKHDGGNDSLAIKYCLEAEGIELNDLSLVVQCANFNIPSPFSFYGKRVFQSADSPRIINLSHHTAHAYSALGTSPFKKCTIMVIDGCGSPVNQVAELNPEQRDIISEDILSSGEMYCEKDSFYHYDGQEMIPLWKDFSSMSTDLENPLALPNTKHSIGGFYAAVSNYVFGNMDDVGKLMGLAPFGRPGIYDFKAFEFKSDRLYVNQSWKSKFKNPSTGYNYFKNNFSYYADIARWAQEQVEIAVLKCFELRISLHPHKNICYTGGVALNAVANAKLIERFPEKSFHFEPSPGDNGLALGCAYYGWLTYMKRGKTETDGSTCYGKKYDQVSIDNSYGAYSDRLQKNTINSEHDLMHFCAAQLKKGKTLAWFQSASEFGPRALGRRSILAHPGIEGLKDHINKNIKFREDFRPFAPAVLKEYINHYFENGHLSPYMILVDQTRPEYLEKLRNVTHCNGSSRVQTVDKEWNPRFDALLREFHNQTGLGVLLNTSLNRKGKPMVETPGEAIQLFLETDLDVLIMETTIIEKKKRPYDEEMLNRIISFLDSVDIRVIEKDLIGECFMPGYEIGPECIYIDRNRIKHPGDLLHEAGHLAVTEPDQRKLIGTELIDDAWPTEGEEIASILWSYAALKYMGIDPEVVFHEEGYKNESDWIISELNNGNYIGLPFLEWIGICYGPEKSRENNIPPFPHIIKWLR